MSLVSAEDKAAAFADTMITVPDIRTFIYDFLIKQPRQYLSTSIENVYHIDAIERILETKPAIWKVTIQAHYRTVPDCIFFWLIYEKEPGKLSWIEDISVLVYSHTRGEAA